MLERAQNIVYIPCHFVGIENLFASVKGLLGKLLNIGLTSSVIDYGVFFGKLGFRLHMLC